jgi:hypothetical protein
MIMLFFCRSRKTFFATLKNIINGKTMNKKITLIQLFVSALLFAAGMLMVNSCKDEELAPVTISKEIDKMGGTLKGTDGIVNLTIPEGAVAANTTISIKVSEEVSPTNGIGKVYTLSPDGTQFTKPVKLSFQYSDEDALNKPSSTIAIAFKKSDDTWQIMPTLEIDEATHTVTTETTHFSQWTLLEVPTILSFEPASGKVGTIVTVHGENFSATASENKVLMNGLQATVTSSTTKQIVFIVPVGATTGKFSVQTIYNTFNYTLVAATDFTVESSEPEITSFSPANGVVGSTVTLTGKNFSTVATENTVMMSGLNAVITSSNTTQITFIVPAGATTGKISIQTQVGQLLYTALSATDYTVDSSEPVITSFSPASGAVGTVVTITGKNFSSVASDNMILMNNLQIVPISSSATQLVFTVQAGATTDKIFVLTKYNGFQFTVVSASDFVVDTNEPIITSFSPTSGSFGTVVTITGKNFSPVAGDNKVLLNGTLILPSSASSTQVVFTVPQGAATGKITIQTKFNDLVWSVVSTSDFVVN